MAERQFFRPAESLWREHPRRVFKCLEVTIWFFLSKEAHRF
jgi:hypothetical protein